MRAPQNFFHYTLFQSGRIHPDNILVFQLTVGQDKQTVHLLSIGKRCDRPFLGDPFLAGNFPLKSGQVHLILHILPQLGKDSFLIFLHR